MERLTCCPFCNSNIRPFWQPVDVWRCEACGLLFRNPFPSEADLVNLYNVSWADPQEHLAETGGTNLAMARVFARRLTNDLKRRDFRGLKILELGSGKGEMLEALQEMGADLYGVEPYGHEYLVQKGHRVYPTLDELPNGLRFDGIISIDVIEHLPAPWDTVRRLYDLLEPGGFFYLTTANSRSLNARLSGPRWREVQKEGHIVMFTSASLKKILDHTGFDRYRRPNWFVPYSRNSLRNLAHFGLQLFGLDGELRYLARKS